MTAVEFLFDAVYKDMSYPELLGLIAQAKEMEKQQQGYSEEEVLEIIRQYALEEHLITSSKPDIWFKQFKK